MAISQNQIVDYLNKKVGYGVAKTDLYTAKQPYNESIASPLLVPGATVLQQDYAIPNVSSAPSANTVLNGSTIVSVYNTSTSAVVQGTALSESETNETWSTGIVNWIPPSFGSGYQLKIYAGPPGATVAQVANFTNLPVAGSGASDSWFFDYQSGVLNFADTIVPTAAANVSNVVYFMGAVYTGTLGITNYANLNVVGNLTSVNGNIVLTNGNLYAAYITGNLAGGASSSLASGNANVAAYATITPLSNNQTYYLEFSNIATAGNSITGVYPGLNYNPSSGTLNAGTLVASTVNAATIGNTGAVFSGANETLSGTLIASTVNAATIGNTGAVFSGANETLSGTLIAATVNAATIGNTGTTFSGANETLSGTLIASTVNAATIGNAGAVFSGASETLTGTLIAATVNAATIGNTGALVTAATVNSTYSNPLNLATANAVVTGGSVNATPVGNATPSTGAFTTLSASTWANITSTTDATSTTSAALVVAGGVATGANIWVGGNATIVGNLTVKGTTTSVNSEIINQTEVVAGTLTANSAAASTSFTSGQALLVAGGVGVVASAYIAGGVQNSPIGNTTPSTGNFTNLNATTTLTAATINAATLGNIGANHVGTGTYLTSLTPTNIAGTVPTANVAYYVNTTASSTNAAYYPLFASTTSGNLAVDANNALQFNPVTGNLFATSVVGVNVTGNTILATVGLSTANAVITGGTINNTIIGGTTAAAGYFAALTTSGITTINNSTNGANGSGALVIPNGGAYIAGNLWVGGNINLTSTTNNVFTGNSGQFFGNAAGYGALYTGIPTGYVVDPLTVQQITANFNNYAGIIAGQNLNGGALASADIFLTPNNGTYSDTYLDLGIASSSYSYPGYGLISPNDAYLFNWGNAITGGGNLILGTGAVNDIVFAVQGINTNNEVMRITRSNVVAIKSTTTSTTNANGALTVAGGVGIAGNLNVGSPTVGYHTIQGNLIIGPNGASNGFLANSSVVINQNASATQYSTSVLHLSAASGQVGKVTLDSFANASIYIARRADGSALSPSAVQSGEVLGAFIARGYGATGFQIQSPQQSAGVNLQADQNFTDSAQGTRLNFTVIPQGSIIGTTAASINSNGNLLIYTTTPSTSGLNGALVVAGGVGVSGNINVAGGINAAAIGNVTPGTGNFTTLNSTTGITASSVQAATIGNVGASGAFGTIIAATVNAATIGNVGANVVGTGTYLTSLNPTNIAGTVATANVAYYDNVATTSTNATYYPSFYNATSGNVATYTNSAFNFNPSTGNLTATGFVGNGYYLTGISVSSLGQVPSANVANYEQVATTSTNATYYPSFYNTTSGNLAAYTNSSLNYNPSTGQLSAPSFNGSGTSYIQTLQVNGTFTGCGTVAATSGASSTSTSTGALQVTGGAGVTGNLYVGSTGVFGSALNYVPANAPIQVGLNINNYSQFSIQNANNGNNASTDIAAVANNGSDNDTYVDMGIVSSGYSQVAYNLYNPNDGYLIVAGNTTTGGGNLILNTYQKNDIIFATGGTTTKFEVARITSGNVLVVKSTNNASPAANIGAFNVWGGASITGNTYHGGATVFNGSQASGNDMILKGVNDNTLLWARPNNTYDSVIIGNSATASTAVTGAKLIINTTDSMIIPSGTSAQRPATGVVGMVRYNTTSGGFEYYNGTQWAAPASQITTIVESQFTGDGTTTTFTMSQSSTTASTLVSINGILQIGGASYAYTVSGAVITFSQAPAAGDIIDYRIITTTSTVTALSSSTGYTGINVATDATGIVFQTNTNSVATTVFTMPPGGGMVSNDANIAISSSNTPTTIDTISNTTYRSAKYIVQATNGANYQTMEVLVMQGGGNAYVVAYGTLQTSNLGVISASVSGSNTLVQFTATNASTNIRLFRNYMLI